MTETRYRDSLLSETREELAKADAKASILLAASGIAFAALLTAGSTASWYPDKLSCHSARVLAWVAVTLTFVGIVFVGAAVKPRLRAKRPHRGNPHYFGDVEAYWPRWWQLGSRKKLRESRRRQFAAALERTSSEREQNERLDDQIWILSHIAYRKYRLVSIGMWLYTAAAAAALVALVLEKRWL
jgi:hypothetical protein